MGGQKAKYQYYVTKKNININGVLSVHAHAHCSLAIWIADVLSQWTMPTVVFLAILYITCM